ncbi:MAG: hypothetical protein R3345_04815, partial [Fulvivirga sp.]|nr:hypothetical protein [Fulvivirga sp.]
MKKTLFTISLSVILLHAFGQTPALFEPVSDELPNRDLAISPDGSMMLTTIQSYKREVSVIMLYTKTSEGWLGPAVAPFSGNYKDLEPAFSPDGKRLYFASNRPTPERPEKLDFDIWYVELEGNGWGVPRHLPETINTGANEFYPSVTENGDIYFTAAYEDSKGAEDIYVSRFKNGNYQQAVNAGDSINSKTY